ncbi:MAG: YtxH domain-containing protein [Bacteroidetes bacterium]|nr:YtxH domain-containing protein [Rhodothermia bacterium]MCS7156025.1 YtxH domain-containing protein [Bacteroidota bacterium]MCX7907713.1 YtxH domain-containing protein [Bacteroidota bacterium]MDW8137842.1 YtxH domain-containing protein [Bacteroidota bacterium]MDW8286307.1 YtxH domain-containing protein [Bacteroidota bacterium]
MATDGRALGRLLIAAAAFLGGLAVGLLFAPRSGAETRRILGAKAREAGQWAGEKVGHLRQEAVARIREGLARVEAELEHLRERVLPDLGESVERASDSDLLSDLSQMPK